MVCPRHTPGVYTTPVAFISANVLDLSFFVVISSCQKQSINDASQYVVVLTHPPEGVGMDVAKIQNFWELTALWGKKMKITAKLPASFRNTLYLCSVKCMFDYPGRIPRGSKTLSTLLHLKPPSGGFNLFKYLRNRCY